LTGDDDDDAIERKQEALEDLQLHTEDVDLANGYLLIFYYNKTCFVTLFLQCFYSNSH